MEITKKINGGTNGLTARRKYLINFRTFARSMSVTTPMAVINKIRYRLTFNRARRLNRQGEGLIQIEMEMQGRRRYLSTHVYVRPDQWRRGMVVNHPLSDQLNLMLWQQRVEVERVELEYVRRGIQVSLWQMQDAVRRHLSPSARLYDFGRAMTQDSDRREHTKQGYMTLLNSKWN